MHLTSVYGLKLSVLRGTGRKALASDHRVQKLPSYKFYGGNVVCVPFQFSFTATHFHPAGR